MSPHGTFTPEKDVTMRQGSVGLETQASGSLASSLLSHVHRVPLVSGSRCRFVHTGKYHALPVAPHEH